MIGTSVYVTSGVADDILEEFHVGHSVFGDGHAINCDVVECDAPRINDIEVDAVVAIPQLGLVVVALEASGFEIIEVLLNQLCQVTILVCAQLLDVDTNLTIDFLNFSMEFELGLVLADLEGTRFEGDGDVAEIPRNCRKGVGLNRILAIELQYAGGKLLFAVEDGH